MYKNIYHLSLRVKRSGTTHSDHRKTLRLLHDLRNNNQNLNKFAKLGCSQQMGLKPPFN